MNLSWSEIIWGHFSQTQNNTSTEHAVMVSRVSLCSREHCGDRGSSPGFCTFLQRKLPQSSENAGTKLQQLPWRPGQGSLRSISSFLCPAFPFVCHHEQDSPSATSEASDFGDGQGFSDLQAGWYTNWHLPHGEFPRETVQELSLTCPVFWLSPFAKASAVQRERPCSLLWGCPLSCHYHDVTRGCVCLLLRLWICSVEIACNLQHSCSLLLQVVVLCFAVAFGSLFQGYGPYSSATKMALPSQQSLPEPYTASVGKTHSANWEVSCCFSFSFLFSRLSEDNLM